MPLVLHNTTVDYDLKPTEYLAGGLLFGITFPLINGVVLDEAHSLPSPPTDLKRIKKDEVVLEFHKSHYVVDLTWKIRVCCDPTNSPWTIEGKGKVAGYLRSIAKRTGQVIPTEAYECDQARVIPLPNYRDFSNQCTCHEFQHYEDHRYLAELIFKPWCKWVDWLSTSPVTIGYTFKEDSTATWILGGGDYARNILNLTKAYHSAVNDSGDQFHHSDIGSQPTLKYLDHEGGVAKISATASYPQIVPGTPFKWYEIGKPASVNNLKRGAAGIITGVCMIKPQLDEFACFVEEKAIKEYES